MLADWLQGLAKLTPMEQFFMTDDLFLTYVSDGSSDLLVLQQGDATYALDDRLPSLDWLLTNVPADEIVGLVQSAKREPLTQVGQPRLILGTQEIWAAGVTYKRSEEAREVESNNSTIYTRVYSAERPEIFFKAIGHDAVSSGQHVGIRYDAKWSVPEPELVVVLNSRMQVVGFTAGNDMSSRDIEGANPLYLPQAKVYEAACSVGPRLWLRPGVTQWPDVAISGSIKRGSAVAFSGETSTGNLHRTLTDLVTYLGRCKRFSHGALLFTGTGVVPPDTFTLEPGDEVTITIDPIGTLVNPVKVIEALH